MTRRSEIADSPRFSDDPRIRDIRLLADERRFWMRLRIGDTNRLVAQLRSMLHPGRGQDDEWSDETKTMAKTITDEALAAFLHDRKGSARERKAKLEHPLLKSSIVTGAIIALAEYTAREDAALAEMTRIVAALPIAAFIDDRCKGFSLAGLAVLIGHAGDFRDYPKKGHLWKRFGLAPYAKDDAVCAGSTWGKTGGLNADDWMILGYKKSRLGDIFGKITQPLFYAQWRSTGAIGRYGELYGAYKARQKAANEAGAFTVEAERQVASLKKRGHKPSKTLAEGRLSAAQINARALRYMTKKLVEHLWTYWRTLDVIENATPGTSALTPSRETAARGGKGSRTPPASPSRTAPAMAAASISTTRDRGTGNRSAA